MNDQDIKDLFENNLALYKEKVRSGEIPHEHHLHWDNSSETFNTEIQSCCECDYVDFPRLNSAEKTIQRVRRLALKAFNDGMGVPMNDERLYRRLFAAEILESLKGEQ